MSGYRGIACGLLATVALWLFPLSALAAGGQAAGEGETGILAPYLRALRERDGVEEERVLTPEEEARLKQEEKERKAQEKREEKERKAREKREKKHKKREIKKYQIVYEDDSYVYYVDQENLRWRSIPYTEERMLDVWIRLIPVADAAEAETREAAGDLYTGHYYLEHYYMRRRQRQVQFLAELEVNGRPQNDVAAGKYSSAAWEDLVPGSLEDALYHRIMKKVTNPKDQALSTSVSSILEDVFHIYI
ncbi:MAG: hypothetical protein ACTTKW_02715 [Schwartzia sp. (in: firmicutes)]